MCVRSYQERHTPLLGMHNAPVLGRGPPPSSSTGAIFNALLFFASTSKHLLHHFPKRWLFLSSPSLGIAAAPCLPTASAPPYFFFLGSCSGLYLGIRDRLCLYQQVVLAALRLDATAGDGLCDKDDRGWRRVSFNLVGDPFHGGLCDQAAGHELGTVAQGEGRSSRHRAAMAW